MYRNINKCVNIHMRRDTQTETDPNVPPSGTIACWLTENVVKVYARKLTERCVHTLNILIICKCILIGYTFDRIKGFSKRTQLLFGNGI